MTWWNKNKAIPLNNENFRTIIQGLLFECPTSVRSRENNGKDENGKRITKSVIHSVSARANTFKRRGITGHYLTTILVAIRKPMVANNAYHVIETSLNVEDKMEEILNSTVLADPNFDVIVMFKRDKNEMPETEALYYYLRNAFAHGSFEYVLGENGTESYYLLESKQKDTVKAQMRLKESTLLKIVKLSKMTSNEIKEMQKPKKH